MVMVVGTDFAGSIPSLTSIVGLQARAGADHPTIRRRVLVLVMEPGVAGAPRHRSLAKPAVRKHGIRKVFIAWTQRPFLGRPGSRIEFIQSGPQQNAYLEIWKLVSQQCLR